MPNILNSLYQLPKKTKKRWNECGTEIESRMITTYFVMRFKPIWGLKLSWNFNFEFGSFHYLESFSAFNEFEVLKWFHFGRSEF